MRSFLSVLFLGALGCATETAEIGCLDADRQAYLESVLQSETGTAGWMLDFAADNEVPFALALPGTERTWLARASLMFPCMEPSTFDPFCEDFEEGLAVCGRIGCDSAGVHRAEMWFSDEAHREDPSDHALGWSSTAPEGEATAPVNPQRTWLLDITGDTHATTTVDVDVQFETATSVVDGQYTGTVDGVHGAVPTLELALVFPELVGGEPVHLDMRIEGDIAVGTVSIGERTVGDVHFEHVEDGSGWSIAWTETCE